MTIFVALKDDDDAERDTDKVAVVQPSTNEGEDPWHLWAIGAITEEEAWELHGRMQIG